MLPWLLNTLPSPWKLCQHMGGGMGSEGIYEVGEVVCVCVFYY